MPAGILKSVNDPACIQCGFSLRGFEPGQSPPRCPECAAAFDVDKPWRPALLPTPLARVWLLCGPAVVTHVLLLAASVTSISRNLLVWPFFLIWLSAIVAFDLLWPWGWAYETARERVPVRDRPATLRRWLLPALFFNASVTIVTLTIFFLML